MEYVQTQFGNIHISDLPIVIPEPFKHKFGRSAIFFSVIIIILFSIIYLANWYVPHNKPVCIKIDALTKKIPSVVKADTVMVYNPKTKMRLENILIITADNNLINIDKTNPRFLTSQQMIGSRFMINLGNEYDIKSITLISDIEPCNYIKLVNIDLLKGGSKVWEYCGYLADRRENTIPILTNVFDSSDQDIQMLELDEVDNSKLVINETELALQLNENDEKYVSH